MRLSRYAGLKDHWPLGVVLLIYVAIASVHSLVVPLTMGNDEWAHFLYIRFIAEHGRLPTNLAERSNWDEVGYKSDDPPLYHLFVSGVTAGVEPTRLLRPINAPRRQLADSVVYPYEFILHTGPEMFPYWGEVLLWHLARGVSIVFGMVAIGVTYVTSLELFKNRRWATQAAALLAFMPAFIFHSSVVSYDSLSAAITGLFLLVGIQTVKQPQRWRWWLLLGVLAGLAITTKYSSVLLPLEIVFIGWLAYRVTRQRALFTRILVAGLAALLAASWWFGFLVWHFNTVETQGWFVGILEPLIVRDSDSTAVSITDFLLGEESVSPDAPPSPLARDYLYLARHTVDSFWAASLNGKFILSPWPALLFTVAGLLGLAGLWWAWQRSDEMARTWLILLLFHTLLITPLLLVRLFLSFDPLEVAQGRHILIPAASAIAILLVWGWEQGHRKLSQICITGLLLWSVIGQLGWAAVVYPLPLSVWAESPEIMATQPRPVDETLVDALHLTGIAWQESPDRPVLEVTLWWQALAEMQQDYLVELALLDQADNIVSYTVGHPIQGRYPTRAWEPGDVVKDVHWLPLVGPLEGVYQLRLRLLTRQAQPVAENQTISLGKIDLTHSTFQPDPCAVWFEGRPAQNHLFAQAYRVRSTLTVIGPEPPTLEPVAGQAHHPQQKPLLSINNLHFFIVGPDWADSYQLVVGSKTCRPISFDLPPRHFALPEIPNPLAANFNNEVELLGYELPTRRIQLGQRLPLTLYWRALAYMGEDYHIFDNLLDQQQRRWGGYDRRAQDGYSTLLWVPGEVITDAFGVPVDPAAPDGVYTLDLGLYRQTEQGAVSLPLVVDGQPTEQTSLRLGPIKVGGPPPDVVMGGPPPDVVSDSPTPQVRLNQTLGDQITLLGYDLSDQDGQPISTLSSPVSSLELTLYWQADVSPAADYTTFLHLRDGSNQTVAQKDTPPAGGRYPTSLWDPGEIIIDEISLPLDNVAPGRYTPVVGLYNLATGDRLLVPGHPNNEISLESINLP